MEPPVIGHEVVKMLGVSIEQKPVAPAIPGRRHAGDQIGRGSALD